MDSRKITKTKNLERIFFMRIFSNLRGSRVSGGGPLFSRIFIPLWIESRDNWMPPQNASYWAGTEIFVCLASLASPPPPSRASRSLCLLYLSHTLKNREAVNSPEVHHIGYFFPKTKSNEMEINAVFLGRHEGFTNAPNLA